MIEYNSLTVDEYISTLNSVKWKLPSVDYLRLL